MHALLAAAALAFAAHLALQPMGETDLFFHLKIGDLILDEGRIPFRNLFSYTFPDAPDLDLSWAFQVLVSLLFRAGGFPALVALKVACVTAAVALAHRAARRAGAGALPAALAAVACALAMQQRIVERPHLVTFVGLGALSLLLVEIERGRERLLWAIPPLVLVWANFHAGVFLAGVVLLTWTIGARLDGVPRPRWRLPVLALSGAAFFATPAGALLPRYLLWHTGLGAVRDIEEFRRADPWDDPWFFTLAAACVVTLLLLGRNARLFRRALPALVVALLAWRSVRFAAEAALLLLPAVAVGASHLLGTPRRARGTSALAAAALLLVVGLERAGRAPEVGLAADIVPFRAIDFVTRNGLRERLFHDLDVGCYLLWEGWPRYRVFEDARLPAYPDDFHRALDASAFDPPRFAALLDRFGVDAALVNYPDVNVRAGAFPPETWALVYRASDALVFARRVPRHAGVIARHELPLKVTFRLRGGAHVEPLWTRPQPSPVPECDWLDRLARVLDDEADPRALVARSRALTRGCLSDDAAARVIAELRQGW